MILLMNSKFEITKCHWVVKVKNLQFKNYLSLAAEHHRPDGWQSYVGAQCSKAHGTLCCYEVKLLAFILPWSLREVQYLTFIINVTCTVGKNPTLPSQKPGKKRKMVPSAMASQNVSEGHSSSSRCKYCLFTALTKYTTACCCTYSAGEVKGLLLADWEKS